MKLWKGGYNQLKEKQIFYNSKLLLNKNKKKIDNLYVNISNINLKKDKINANILKDNDYLIVDPNSNIIMHYDASSNLKYIISVP